MKKRLNKKAFQGHLPTFEAKAKLLEQRNWYRHMFTILSEENSKFMRDLRNANEKIVRDQFMLDELKKQMTQIKLMQASNVEDARQIIERAGHKVRA